MLSNGLGSLATDSTELRSEMLPVLSMRVQR